MTKKDKPTKKYLFLKILGALAAVFFILSAISFPLRTVRYTLVSHKVSKKVRIVQISDLHSCSYGEDMKNLINAVDAAEPDIIVLTGDIFDNRTDNKNSDTLLKAIAKKYPCYYVSGNHEYRGNMWDTFSRRAESFGVTVLQGENVDIDGITICGASAKSDIGDSVKVCADNADTDSFNILLAHFPENIDFYRSFGKFDLVLSGHAHGGQWRLPPFINGLYAPGQGLFPKYAGGRYDFDDTTFIVSRGLSRTMEHFPRIFNNPELVVIDILPEGEDGE